MLPGLSFFNLSSLSGPDSLIDTIGSIGISSGLKLCLDFADGNTYGGSGQTVYDLSGNGYDYYLGTNSSSQTSDPTFVGSANSRSNSTYFELDYGATETMYPTYGIPSWQENLHKNNAVTAFIYAFQLIYDPVLAGDSTIGGPVFNTGAVLSNVRGININIQATFVDIKAPENNTPPQIGVAVSNGTTYNFSHYLDIGGICNSTYSPWVTVIGRLDETDASTGSFLKIRYGAAGQANSTQSGAYTSPSTLGANNAGRIADYMFSGGASYPPRLNCFAIWEGTIPSKADLITLQDTFHAARFT